MFEASCWLIVDATRSELGTVVLTPPSLQSLRKLPPPRPQRCINLEHSHQQGKPEGASLHSACH